MSATKMTSLERKSIISLASIMSLRMIGLFMVLPVFALYAHQLKGATPALIGLAIGIYGLFQALCQIPFGWLSDRLGRKPIILAGLILFACGSLLAACAHSITFMIIGRALQGTGAIGGVTLAMMADLTREEQRTKAMAIAGMTIGFSFALAMLIGPLLTKWLPVNSLFFLAAIFAGIAIFMLYTSVPQSQTHTWHRDTEPEWRGFLNLLCNPQLAKLNIGIFILHALFTASFIVIPLTLKQFLHLEMSEQWHIYLPTLLVAFFSTLICIGFAERKQQVKIYFLASIFSLGLGESFLWLSQTNPLFADLGLCLFFVGFTLLEAFLPSLISRSAPAARKGTAMGIYSCTQFLGIFMGGVIGGWLYGQFSFAGVYLFCMILLSFWFALAFFMQPPRYLTTYMLRLLPSKQSRWESVVSSLQNIPGMVEITFIAEDSIAYLKMERKTVEHPEFIRLKLELQSE